MIEKPNLTINQQFELNVDRVGTELPTLILGARYNVKRQELLATYSGEETENIEYDYPNREAFTEVDTEYSDLIIEQATLNYYNSVTEGSVWRKIGSAPNKLRTILANGLIFQDDTQQLFPHSTIFKDRGVKVGDPIRVRVGASEVNTIVQGFEADQSVATLGTVEANAANQVAQVNTIGAAAAGAANSTNTTVTSNTGGTYAGSLSDNVLSDKYNVRVINGGTIPTLTVEENNTASALIVEANEFYDFAANETYTIRIITGGALETATYVVESLSGIDNIAEQTTPALTTFVDLGTRGAQFQFTGSGVLTAGDTFVINCTPSEARLQVSTESGIDETPSRVFPGYDTAFSISELGLEITVAENASAILNVADNWDIDTQKAVDVIVANEVGTFTGPVDINYFIEVVVGGEYGATYLSVTSTFNDSNQLVLVNGSGSGNPVNIGSYGAQLYFDANTQNGLVLGDAFTLKANAAKDTAFKTIVTKSSLPSEADNATIGSATYTGSNGTPNTGTSGGAFNSSVSRALELYNQEIYTVVVSTDGAYGAAEITVTSSSGLSNATGAITIPVTPGTPIEIGSGVTISFIGANSFELTDRWTVTATKPDLEVTLGILKESVSVPEFREDNPILRSWESKEETFLVNAGLCLQEDTWDPIECLPVRDGVMYLKYRALHTTGAEDVYTFSNTSVEDILGVNDIDNPISRGTFLAVTASESDPIRAMYVKSDDLTGWTDALAKLELRNEADVYRIIPMTSDANILLQVESHVNKLSTKNKWRVGYFSRELPEVLDVIGTAESSDFTATIVEDTSNTGQFTVMQTTNANFELIQVGDFVRYLGDDIQIVEVRTATEMVLDKDFGAVQSVPSTIYVYHNPTVRELAELSAFYSQQYSNRRIINVAPDEFTGLGELHQGYYLAALIGGYKASLPPHRPLSRNEIPGVDRVDKMLFTFSEDDQDVMANGGNFIVTQDSLNQVPYVRHQLTTDVSNLKLRELSYTENFDSICYGIKQIAEQYVGRYNLNQAVISQISTDIEGFLYTRTEFVDDISGPQIEDILLLEVLQDPNQADRLIINIRLQLPAPLNYIDITITV